MDFPRGSAEAPGTQHESSSGAGKLLQFPGEGEAAPLPPPAPSRSAIWLRRMSLIIFVLFCVELGMVLIVLPWTRLWTENNLLLAYPQVRDLMNSGFVRGAVTGFGLIDIYVGIREAVLYREK